MHLKLFKKNIKVELPIDVLRVIFEKYELYLGLGGILVAFLFAGMIFYFNVYKDITSDPDISVEKIEANEQMLADVLRKLEAKQQISAQEPVIDPFR